MNDGEITGNPKPYSPVDREYAAAIKEGRQPNCPHCGKPLEIRLTEQGGICWVWDDELKCFEVQHEGSAHLPYCAKCLYEDASFVDHDLVEF